MNKNIKLTIAIPTLNRSHCIERAIESALAQKTDEIEIIISNNGSTDNTAEIISKYNDPRIKIITHETTITAVDHANFLFEMARGRFFLGLSDDDYIEPNFCTEVFEFLDETPDVSFVYTGCNINYDEIPVPAKVGPKLESGIDFIEGFFENKRQICWCACVTRLDLVREIGELPADEFFGDMYYWTRLAFMGSVGCIEKKLSNYTFMSDNMSSALPVPKWDAAASKIAKNTYSRYCQVVKSRKKNKAAWRAMKQYLSISIGNQFVWNAIRGRSRKELIIWIPGFLKHAFWVPGPLLQVFASIILPREKLKTKIYEHAKKLAKRNS